MRDGGAAEADSDLVKTGEVAVGEIRIPLTDVIDGLIHPNPLIVFFRLEDAAAVDMTKKLVPSPFEKFFLTQFSLRLCSLEGASRAEGCTLAL